VERALACALLVVGGQLVREPGGTIDALGVATMAWVLRTFVMRRMIQEAETLVQWCFEGAPPAFRFVYARMGQMVDAPSRGSLRAQPTPKNIQHGSASYVDVADAFVRLAGDAARTWERKAVYFNYVA
jgi:hypothetical protein